MISVEFKSVGAGTCQWCGKEKDEVFDIAYSDKSFVGLYCRGDLMKAVTVKCGRRTKQTGVTTGQGTSNGQTAGGTMTTTGTAVPEAEVKK